MKNDYEEQKEKYLSEEAQEDLEEEGYLEFGIPFIWKEELEGNEPSTPHRLTVDVVPDEDMNEYLENIGYFKEDRPTDVLSEVEEYLSERIGFLLGNDRILKAYYKEAVRSPDDLKEKIHNMKFILKRRG